ncbi:MAG: hypothetical protein HGA39_01385 [Coriobacteriia bacterium]|nr:hypothetical protein [Coriobacteriia bacterium]
MFASIADQLALGNGGGILALGIAFAGGVLGGFSPCVLPLVPAVLGYVTGSVGRTETENSAHKGWWRGLALSATFVVGMSLVFAVIGAAAGLFGYALRIGPLGYYLAAIVSAVLGLSMLGVINLNFDALNRFMPMKRPGRRGVLGALLFGMVFGLVASPCATPILGAIATIAMVQGSALKGAVLLFAYGLGYGVPLLVLGVASGSLGMMRSLSRTTGVLTKIGGAALLVAAVYLVWIA